MSSTMRFRISGQAQPKPMNVIHLTYDSGDIQAPIPLTYNKQGGVLDLDFSGDFSATTEINTNRTFYVQGSTFTAVHIVNSIGANLVAWATNELGADSGSVTMYKNPVVVRANGVQLNLVPDSVDSWQTGITTPVDFESAAGSPILNNYYSTYLFKAPLVLRYTVGGSVEYAVMATQFEGNT